MALVHWCIVEFEITATDILHSSKENVICKQYRFPGKNKICDCFSQRVRRLSYKNFKYWIPPDMKKVSKTSLPRTRRNFKLCKAQLPDHKRYYLSGVCVCLSFRKEKLWNGRALKTSSIRQLFLSFSPLSGLSLFHTQTCAVVFSCLPVNLMFYSLNISPFVLPCVLRIAVQTQKASLAPIIFRGGWQTESLELYWGPFNALHFYSLPFPACTHSISHSSCCNLPRFVLQECITFLCTPFAFTLFAITNLTRFWLLFTSGIPCPSTSSFTPLICKPDALNCFHFLSQIYLLCYKNALYHALVTSIAECIHLLSPHRENNSRQLMLECIDNILQTSPKLSNIKQ